MLFNCTSLFSTYFRCLTCALTGERWLGFVCRRVADRRSVREIEVRGAPRCPFPHAGRIFGRVVAPRMMTRQPPQPLARSQRSYQQADSAAIFARSTIALPGHLRHPAARRPKPAVPPLRHPNPRAHIWAHIRAHIWARGHPPDAAAVAAAGAGRADEGAVGGGALRRPAGPCQRHRRRRKARARARAQGRAKARTRASAPKLSVLSGERARQRSVSCVPA